MNVLDLFSGIGGFSLGLERAGMRTVAFCEIDPYCRAILRKHWPDIPRYDDVRAITAERLAADGITPDIICGGFPCQDISIAGKGAGIGGERSGLWSEYARIIGEVRPRHVIVENVAALLHRGIERVLGDLAALGFDAEWHCIPASAVGAPHRRDRVWIVAHAAQQRINGTGATGPRWRHEYSNGGCDVAHTNAGGQPQHAQCNGEQGPRLNGSLRHNIERCCMDGWWLVEPDVGRVAHGVPARVDRLRALGNAIVPQIAEIIGRAIMHADQSRGIRPAVASA